MGTNTKVNVKNTSKISGGERRTGMLKDGLVTTSDGEVKSLEYYESIDKNGIGFFETRVNGKVVQKTGRYKDNG